MEKMKKILVNVNEKNLELIRSIWGGIRGYCPDNSVIVNDLLLQELFRFKQDKDIADYIAHFDIKGENN